MATLQLLNILQAHGWYFVVFQRFLKAGASTFSAVEFQNLT